MNSTPPKRNPMKKTLIALLNTSLGGGGPFIALHNLSAALQDHDAHRRKHRNTGAQA